MKIFQFPTLAFWCRRAGPKVDVIKSRGAVVHLGEMRPCSSNRGPPDMAGRTHIFQGSRDCSCYWLHRGAHPKVLAGFFLRAL